MAQTGFTPISLYYTTTAAAAPTAGNLVAGELAINTQDGKLFYKDAAGVVQTIASKDANSGIFAAGTVSAPSITFTGDTNTGIYSPAADTIAFTEGGAESMRIDSSGNFLLGTTAAITSGKQTISYNGVVNNGITISESANTNGTSYLVFNQGSTVIGTVARVGATSAVIYNTTSDERLKSNIVDANPVLDKLMDVKVRQFDWTLGDLHQDAGFIAQELAPVLSGIVTEGRTEEDMWQLDYSRLTPYLVKAIQELKAELDSVKTELATLKA